MSTCSQWRQVRAMCLSPVVLGFLSGEYDIQPDSPFVDGSSPVDAGLEALSG
jgi:hypothetical protein